ncbi:unnamed protein product [Photorhabdus laumondii subsp. laumondii TTO1]|uniref:Photorhabdus luminescens subsp. laumondii TTO1 complete genome segment 7/17 n=1 Tax=Photorhabdus laumondii subsp. laumondii (strain DSM 15139 / CIP 105565 / TT01) TaxID=243265 RepID=Q7N5U0_PHOLL|nr:unnamed protein product [Photorhabdus laumondii subsp. laumondii TTO1]
MYPRMIPISGLPRLNSDMRIAMFNSQSSDKTKAKNTALNDFYLEKLLINNTIRNYC